MISKFKHQINVEKKCAGIGCNEIAIHPVTIIYLNKIGWFCDGCKSLIVKEGLAKQIECDPREQVRNIFAGFADPTNKILNALVNKSQDMVTHDKS